VRADLGGANPTIFMDLKLESVTALALDLVHQRIYWIDSDAGMIQRASLNGTDVEDLMFDSFAPLHSWHVSNLTLELCGREQGTSLHDADLISKCIAGPSSLGSGACLCADLSNDSRVDLIDVAIHQQAFRH